MTQYPSARTLKKQRTYKSAGLLLIFYACRTQISGFGIGNTELAEVC